LIPNPGLEARVIYSIWKIMTRAAEGGWIRPLTIGDAIPNLLIRRDQAASLAIDLKIALFADLSSLDRRGPLR